MSTVVEIEEAIQELERPDVESLFSWIEEYVKKPENVSRLPILDQKRFNETSNRVLHEHDALLRKLAQ